MKMSHVLMSTYRNGSKLIAMTKRGPMAHIVFKILKWYIGRIQAFKKSGTNLSDFIEKLEQSVHVLSGFNTLSKSINKA